MKRNYFVEVRKSGAGWDIRATSPERARYLVFLWMNKERDYIKYTDLRARLAMENEKE